MLSPPAVLLRRGPQPDLSVDPPDAHAQLRRLLLLLRRRRLRLLVLLLGSPLLLRQDQRRRERRPRDDAGDFLFLSLSVLRRISGRRQRRR